MYHFLTKNSCYNTSPCIKSDQANEQTKQTQQTRTDNLLRWVIAMPSALA